MVSSVRYKHGSGNERQQQQQQQQSPQIRQASSVETPQIRKPRSRCHIEDKIQAYMEDFDSDNNDDFIPLVMVNSSKGGLEQRSLNDRHESRSHKQHQHQHKETCFGNTWRLLASFVLAALMIVPIMYRLYSNYQHTRNSLSVEMINSHFWPPNNQVCATDLEISFSELFAQLSHYTDLEFCTKTNQQSVVGGGGSGTCSCHSPVIPRKYVPGNTPQYENSWDDQFQTNIDAASSAQKNVDVVLVGDSITEQWAGTELGKPIRQEIANVFQELFVTDRRGVGGGSPSTGISGLPLGLAGDRCEQLLYRLQNGEIPDNLDPKVWWVLIGTNDLSDHCSPEKVLVGTIQIIQLLHEKRPNAWIVVNGILPRPSSSSGTLSGPWWDSISWVNDRLECYCQGLDRVEFFNATDYFVNEDNDKDNHDVQEMIVMRQSMTDWVHPSAYGAQEWGEGIVKAVQELIKK